MFHSQTWQCDLVTCKIIFISRHLVLKLSLVASKYLNPLPIVRLSLSRSLCSTLSLNMIYYHSPHYLSKVGATQHMPGKCLPPKNPQF